MLRVDVTDEEGEVTRAILRLAGAPALRARLGRAAREHVSREHADARTAEAYAEAIELRGVSSGSAAARLARPLGRPHRSFVTLLTSHPAGRNRRAPPVSNPVAGTR